MGAMASGLTTGGTPPAVGGARPPSEDRALLARTRDRLLPHLPADRFWGWVGPLLVTGLAAYLRFHRLGLPHDKVFDEVYYEHDAWNLVQHGVELNKDNTGAGFVVHPPLGKWMIGFGEWVFGHNSYGWRFSAAVVGTLSVLILARTARRMFGSTILGCFAGLLLALEALEFVQSRTSMLDIFLLFWVIAGFACLVLDRDDGRRRLAERLPSVHPRGPRLGFRWWRLAAGVCAGAATATKWSGVWFIALFGLAAWVWDMGARRAAGIPRARRAAFVRDTLPSLLPLLVVPLAVYTVSWTGWFIGDANAWDHDKYVHAGQGTFAHVFAVLHGWFSYHHEVYEFHIHLDSGHPYKSEPWGWLLLARPVAYFYSSPGMGQLGCHVQKCSREVLAIGTPAIWWASIPALIWAIWIWASRRDWRAAIIVGGFAAGYLPWIAFPGRTMFLFYALPSVPFMILALTLAAGSVLGRGRAGLLRRRWGASVVGAFALLVVANFFYFHPVLAAEVIPQSSWHDRMWFQQCTKASKDNTVEVAPCWI